ncbi:hypothetical protein [Brevibacillus choshinensis]|uniref:hypothetical protein n=1 Tax=Brevibacillus choshinensis TaxID=54911 RepID=UPI002E1A1D03|nr:hypothetical protein [Brevibacillus choshinensis]
MSKELEALNTYLTALITHRSELRRDYMIQDKELGKEIMVLLERIRETEARIRGEEFGVDEFITDSGEAEVAVATAEIAPVEADTVPTSRKNRAKLDYPGDVVPKTIALLREAENGLTGRELLNLLKEKYGFEFSNPTIAINRILSFTNEIKKDNRTFYYSSDEIV